MYSFEMRVGLHPGDKLLTFIEKIFFYETLSHLSVLKIRSYFKTRSYVQTREQGQTKCKEIKNAFEVYF